MNNNDNGDKDKPILRKISGEKNQPRLSLPKGMGFEVGDYVQLDLKDDGLLISKIKVVKEELKQE